MHQRYELYSNKCAKTDQIEGIPYSGTILELLRGRTKILSLPSIQKRRKDPWVLCFPSSIHGVKNNNGVLSSQIAYSNPSRVFWVESGLPFLSSGDVLGQCSLLKEYTGWLCSQHAQGRIELPTSGSLKYPDSYSWGGKVSKEAQCFERRNDRLIPSVGYSDVVFWKACWNKKVLRGFLKIAREGARQISGGRSSQTQGAITKKAILLILSFGTSLGLTTSAIQPRIYE